MYSNINSKVRTSNGSSGTFLQKCEVMQGENLSPSLFLISINEIKTIINTIPSMMFNLYKHDMKGYLISINMI